MEIIHLLSSDRQEYWMERIKKCDWRAGQYLHELIRTDKLKELCGDDTQVLLLVEGDSLISFCTYANRDEIDDASLAPWVGFVYTFPEYRGKRRFGKLLEYIYAMAKSDGYKTIYISSGEAGLYEKYGCQFWKTMKSIYGEEACVYRLDIVQKDYSDILGKTVSGTIDRPLGCHHPRHPEMIYPMNYGYVDGVLAGDGAFQDVYLFGSDEPIRTFTGKVIAVYHRLNDCEDKWIVSTNGAKPSKEEILKKIDF